MNLDLVFLGRKKIQKFGASYYIGIPRFLIEAASLTPGQSIKWSAVPGTLSYLLEIDNQPKVESVRRG